MSDAFRVSCIIPAFNEAPRIGRVLEVALRTPAIAEVIVIDDASRDETVRIAREIAADHPALRVLRQPANGGKSRAVARGVAEATGSHLLLLDSDLQGLAPHHLQDLIAPVAEGRADVSISLRGNAPRVWQWIGLDYISGERVIPRGLLADRLDVLTRLPRFGLEVDMNHRLIEMRLRLAVVRWPEVSSPMKYAKQGLRKGLASDAKMMRDIIRTIGPVEILDQIRRMRALRQ